MRERRPGDWRVDLARRHPLETLVENAIDRHPVLTRLSSSTSSMDRLDYQLIAPGERLCELELKAKHQRYLGWATHSTAAETDLFIVDELTVRKLLSAGRYAYMLLRDDPNDRWTLWSLMEIVLATKVRVNRELATSNGGCKAKVLLDLNDTPHHYTDLTSALTGVADLVALTDRHWNAIDPWPSTKPVLAVTRTSPVARAQIGSRIPSRKVCNELTLALDAR